jgi:hypothetical protein
MTGCRKKLSSFGQGNATTAGILCIEKVKKCFGSRYCTMSCMRIKPVMCTAPLVGRRILFEWGELR